MPQSPSWFGVNDYTGDSSDFSTGRKQQPDPGDGLPGPQDKDPGPISPDDRDRLVYRLLAGEDRLVLPRDGRPAVFWLRTPTPLDRYEAAEAGSAAKAEAELSGLYSESDVLSLLETRGLWSAKDTADLETAEKNIENLKVGLYESAANVRARDAAREGLRLTRHFRAGLLARRHQFDDKSAAGYATVARGRFLVGRCLLDSGRRPVWPDDSFAHEDSPLLDAAVQAYSRARLSEGQLRELARTDPWRSVWACRKSENSVFGTPAGKLTEEQRVLAGWSRTYDSAAESPECPPDDVFEDDDMFDGWMVRLRRDRETEAKKSRAEAALKNEKIANAGEVFVVGAEAGQGTGSLAPEDLAAIEEMNSPYAAMTKRRRLATLAKKGFVQEAEMPDSKEKILMDLAKKGVTK